MLPIILGPPNAIYRCGALWAAKWQRGTVSIVAVRVAMMGPGECIVSFLLSGTPAEEYSASELAHAGFHPTSVGDPAAIKLLKQAVYDAWLHTGLSFKE